MSQRAINWGVILTALGLAGAAAVFVSRSVAAGEVAPLYERVGVVENQQVNDGKRLERIEDKLDSVLYELRRK